MIYWRTPAEGDGEQGKERAHGQGEIGVNRSAYMDPCKSRVTWRRCTGDKKRVSQGSCRALTAREELDRPSDIGGSVHNGTEGSDENNERCEERDEIKFGVRRNKETIIVLLGCLSCFLFLFMEGDSGNDKILHRMRARDV